MSISLVGIDGEKRRDPLLYYYGGGGSGGGIRGADYIDRGLSITVKERLDPQVHIHIRRSIPLTAAAQYFDWIKNAERLKKSWRSAHFTLIRRRRSLAPPF